jgi:cytoskeleton protein RodZ
MSSETEEHSPAPSNGGARQRQTQPLRLGLPEPMDVGARLRAAREARQISLNEIAAITKISSAVLEALEQNNLANLPGGIFSRSFVRSYAMEVGLDPEQMVRDFVAQSPVEDLVEENKRDEQSQVHNLFESKQRMSGMALKLALVVVMVAVLLLVLVIRGALSSEDAPEEPAAVEMTRATAPLVPPAGGERTQGPLEFSLHSSDDCWVSLTIDGALVLRRIMRKGERESFDADDEILLNVGDAGAFEFSINKKVGRSLGGSGEVVTARITHQNYRNYVAP